MSSGLDVDGRGALAEAANQSPESGSTFAETGPRTATSPPGVRARAGRVPLPQPRGRARVALTGTKYRYLYRICVQVHTYAAQALSVYMCGQHVRLQCSSQGRFLRPWQQSPLAGPPRLAPPSRALGPLVLRTGFHRQSFCGDRSHPTSPAVRFCGTAHVRHTGSAPLEVPVPARSVDEYRQPARLRDNRASSRAEHRRRPAR